MKETNSYRMITSDFHTNVIHLLHVAKVTLIREPKKREKNVSEPPRKRANPDELLAPEAGLEQLFSPQKKVAVCAPRPTSHPHLVFLVVVGDIDYILSRSIKAVRSHNCLQFWTKHFIFCVVTSAVERLFSLDRAVSGKDHRFSSHECLH
jgi:hypothetical protein